VKGEAVFLFFFQGSGAEPELGAQSLLFAQFLQGWSWSQTWKQSDKEQWEEPNLVLAPALLRAGS